MTESPANQADTRGGGDKRARQPSARGSADAASPREEAPSAGESPDRGSAPAPRPVGELSYTDASSELDGIVEELDRGQVDVDRLVAVLERATAIVDELDRRIARTRVKVEELAPRLERAGREGGVAEDEDWDGDDEAEDGDGG